MHFDEKEVSDLANALFEDAVQVRNIPVGAPCDCRIFGSLKENH